MKLHALTALLFFSAATLGTSGTRAHPQHEHRDVLVARAAKDGLEFAAAKRQADPVVAAALAPSGSSTQNQEPSSSQVASAAHSAASSIGTTATSSLSAGSASASGTGSNSSQPTPVVSGANGVPALSLISSGMPSGTPSPVVSTYAPGATPPFPGGPALPAQCKFLPPVSSPASLSACRSLYWILVVFISADWPAQDKVPDTSKSHFGGPFLGLGTLRSFAQLPRRFKRGCKNSMALTFLHGLQPPTDRAQVIPPLRRRPVHAVGGRVAGPRATQISPRARRS